jgi:parvulin-like peptidyl-prolyl isomerase
MRRVIQVLFGIALLLAVSACGGGGPRNVPNDAVAVVGDQTVTKAEWDALLNQIKMRDKATKQPFPKAGSVELANLRAQVTQFLVTAKEYDQEAKKLDVKVTDKDVETRLDQTKQQVATQPGQPPPSKKQLEQRYQAALKQQGFTDEEVRQGIRLALVREKVQAKVTGDLKVSDSQIKDYYDKHKAQYETPAQPESRPVRHILVKKRALADRLYAQVKANPKLFPKLARKYSTDTTSAKAGGTLAGGDVKGHFVKSFERVAFKLKTHEISKPVHSKFGWHIIEATGPVKPPQPAKPTPLAQVKEAIRQTLLQERRTTVVQVWEQGLMKRYCKTIAYQAGYAPPPGQDRCKQQTTTAATTR